MAQDVHIDLVHLFGRFISHLLLGDDVHLVDVVPHKSDQMAEARLLVQSLEHHPRTSFRGTGGPSPRHPAHPSTSSPQRRPARGHARTPCRGSVGRGLEQTVRRRKVLQVREGVQRLVAEDGDGRAGVPVEEKTTAWAGGGRPAGGDGVTTQTMTPAFSAAHIWWCSYHEQPPE